MKSLLLNSSIWFGCKHVTHAMLGCLCLVHQLRGIGVREGHFHTPIDQGFPASFCKVWPGWQWKASSRGTPTNLGKLEYSDANLRQQVLGGLRIYNGWRQFALVHTFVEQLGHPCRHYAKIQIKVERSRVNVKKSQPWRPAGSWRYFNIMSISFSDSTMSLRPWTSLILKWSLG